MAPRGWLLLSLPLLCLLAQTLAHSRHGKVDVEDNEFAEFEDAEEFADVGAAEETREAGRGFEPPPVEAEEEAVEEEDEELEELREARPAAQRSARDVDDDEFGIVEEDEDLEDLESGGAGLDGEAPAGGFKAGKGGGGPDGGLRFADVPAHLRRNWSNYQVELVMLIGLAAYLGNYLWGRTRNGALAEGWLAANRPALEAQFAMVGDDGVSGTPGAAAKANPAAALVRDTDSTFNVWCSGRAGVEGLLVSLRLLKRQDLVSIIAGLMRPKQDQLVLKLDLEPGEMDSFVFAIGNRKMMAKLAKEMSDLSQYCTEKKNSGSLGLPASFTLLSESMEASMAMVDPKIQAALEKLEDVLEYVHFSDQYTGAKPAEGETCTGGGEPTRSLIFGARLGSEAELEAAGSRLLSLVFYWLEKVRRFRLSREGKTKAERNRATAAERLERTTHSQRQEAAQARREERVRERKERLMAEEDPDKQRRLQKEEHKREAKKKTPKMKQLKIKAM